MLSALTSFLIAYLGVDDSVLVEFLTDVFNGTFILLAYILLGFILRYPFIRAVKFSVNHNPAKDTTIKALGLFFSLLFTLVGFMSAFAEWGADSTILLGVLGLTGVGLTIATQSILSNTVAGFGVLLYAPFDVGTKVTINGTEGTVKKITYRAVYLDDGENLHIIPNSQALGGTVVRPNTEKLASET